MRKKYLGLLMMLVLVLAIMTGCTDETRAINEPVSSFKEVEPRVDHDAGQIIKASLAYNQVGGLDLYVQWADIKNSSADTADTEDTDYVDVEKIRNEKYNIYYRKKGGKWTCISEKMTIVFQDPSTSITLDLENEDMPSAGEIYQVYVEYVDRNDNIITTTPAVEISVPVK